MPPPIVTARPANHTHDAGGPAAGSSRLNLPGPFNQAAEGQPGSNSDRTLGHTATPSQGEPPETGISIPRDRPPIVIAILGAPAAGKDYLQARLLEIAKGIGQAELADTLERGSSLAIDGIRDALHQLPSALKLKAFIDAPKQLQTKGLASWCWRSILDAIGKIDEALDEIAVSVARNGQVLEVSEPLPRDAGHVITSLPETTLQRGLEALHPYGDWRVVVRLEQMKLEAAARQRGDDIVLNETGFDSETMLERLRAFRESNPPYVSLVFLIHGRSAATNLLQNAARMVLGVDDGRDASSSICNTWKHLESVLESYKTCACSASAGNEHLRVFITYNPHSHSFVV